MTDEWTYTDDEPMTAKEAINELQEHIKRNANIDRQAMIGEIKRLRTANEKMKSALEYYADDGPTPNVDGPWKATSWDFGTLARCTLADVAAIQGHAP